MVEDDGSELLLAAEERVQKLSDPFEREKVVAGGGGVEIGELLGDLSLERI